MASSQRHPSTLSADAVKELESKLSKVESLIASDAETIKQQQNTIQQQRAIIERQQTVISKVRDELLELRKEILVNEARSTPQDFRTNLQTYLLSLKQELIALNKQSNTVQGSTTAGADDRKHAEHESDDFTVSASGRTALYIAAGRAVESQRGGKDRLFFDEYAHRFASWNSNAGYNFLQLFADALTQMNQANNIMSEVTVDYLAMFIAFRTKWIDEQIYHALHTDKQRMREGKTKGTIKQMVILGCGCDTRAFRLSKLPKNIKVFNVDRCDVMQFRQQILGSDLGVCQSFDVEADLVDASKPWIKALQARGFQVDKKCIFVAEGIFEYLQSDDLHRLLATLRSCSCAGSWLIGEIPNVVNVQLKDMHDLWVNLGGQRVVTGMDLPKTQILDAFGWSACQKVNVLGIGESNFNERCPESYIQYQTRTEPKKNDRITRIQMFVGMKGEENGSGLLENDEESDAKTQ
mmetsp:Transcript_73784/g.117644  ORF Transcript_73784/g.117644 Transcript_73784/m.117644 type:complete len:466 (-) Transcript_73784:11-1408(-)